MKYNINGLIEKAKQGEQLKYLYFWGHRPSKDGELNQSCLNQWWLADFTVDGITYPTAEHWMMAEKARLFDDTEMLQRIIEANTPAEAKKLGRKVRNFQHEIWESKRYAIVKAGNWHKFNQNTTLKSFLLTTIGRTLVEASPVDSIWGIGMAKDHAAIHNPEQWKGLNLLGFALMEVRDDLYNGIDYLKK